MRTRFVSTVCISRLLPFSQVRALCLEGLCNLADADENKMRMWVGGGGNGGGGGGFFQASPSGRQKLMLKQIRHLLVAGGARGEPKKVRTWALRALCSLAGDPRNELPMWADLRCRRVLQLAAANTGESSSQGARKTRVWKLI